MLDDPDTDAEMRALAHEELQAAKDRLPELEKQLKILLLPKNAVDEKNAILEVRAGTGGEEAALFAAELFRMYVGLGVVTALLMQAACFSLRSRLPHWA